MKNFVVSIFVFAIFAVSSVVMAEDYYEPGTPSANQQTPALVNPKVTRDASGHAAMHRDAVMADAIGRLSQTVATLATACQDPKSGKCGGAIVDEAGKPLPKGLTPQQRRQVRRMLDEAIVMANAGDSAGLKALQTRIATLEGRVDRVEGEVGELKKRVTTLENGKVVVSDADITVDDALSISRRATVAEATANEAKAIAEEAKAKAEDAMANGGGGVSRSDLIKVAEAAGDAQGRADIAGRQAEEAMAKAKEALEAARSKTESGEPLDPAELAKLEAQLADAKESAEKAEAEAKAAKKIAESAFVIASQKQDAGLLEVGLVGQFSPAIKGLMLEGTYWVRKAKVRVGIGGGIGLALDDNPVEFMFDTRVKFGYEFHRYVWGGLYISTYGSGMPFQDEFGYGGGAFVRGVIPLTKELNLGIEGFVGPAYEYAWVPADPPDGIIPGATYDNQKLAGEFVPMGGFSLSLFF
jgi:hypothetical protein